MKPELEVGNVKLDGFDAIQPSRNDAEPFSHRTWDLSNLVAPIPLPCCRGCQVTPQKCSLQGRLCFQAAAGGQSPVSVQISGLASFLAPLLGSELSLPPVGFEESFMLKIGKANKTHGPNIYVDKEGWAIPHCCQFERK